MNTYLLYSSGLDSFIHWRLLGEPFGMYVLLNHRYQDNELQAIETLYQVLARQGKLLQVERVPGFDLSKWEDSGAHIPSRNFIFLNAAALYGASTVYLGALRGESSYDKSGEFLKTSSTLLSRMHERKILCLSPFRHLTKTQLVGAYLKQFSKAVDRDYLDFTYSCYNLDVKDIGTYAGCGECMACFRRWVAMSNNGIYEKYRRPPYTWDVIHPSPERCRLWFRNLTRKPISEWYGILRNNWDARNALKEYGYV